MTGSELTLLVAALMLGALVLGLAGGLLVARLNRPAPLPEAGSPEARLAEAEDARAAAERALEAAQAEFRRALAQKDADLAATMEVLGHVRRELAALQQGQGG